VELRKLILVLPFIEQELELPFPGTNTNYSWRMMGICFRDECDSGWAWSLRENDMHKKGYFDGTTYDGNSLFLSVRRN
jgi:hypothetical protein